MPEIILIVAQSDNRAIGRDNQMPWHLPRDLQHFKRHTLGHPVIMGRKTYDSIGRALPGRQNLVVSRNPALTLPDATVCSDLPAALAAAQMQSPVHRNRFPRSDHHRQPGKQGRKSAPHTRWCDEKAGKGKWKNS